MILASRDLPLGRDASSRVLPMVIGFMVYLASLALAATMILAEATDTWRRGMSGTLTVQVVSVDDAETDETLAERTESTAALLRSVAGVARVRIVPREEVRGLLEPWLGAGASLADLPLPRLIDVTLAPGVRFDTDALAARLSAEIPGSSVDDHAVWLRKLVRIARVIEVLAVGVMLLIGVTAVMTVVFTTRSGLAIHEDIIEVLHLIGAQDNYIARQFQGHALRLGLRGGLLGFVLAAATLIGLDRVTSGLDAALLPEISLSFFQWLALCLLPIVAGAIATLTARFTVLRSIGRMI